VPAIPSGPQLTPFRVNNALANGAAMQAIMKTNQKETKVSQDLAVKAHKLTKSMKRLLNNRTRLPGPEHIVFKVILVSSPVLVIIEAQIS